MSGFVWVLFLCKVFHYFVPSYCKFKELDLRQNILKACFFLTPDFDFLNIRIECSGKIMSLCTHSLKTNFVEFLHNLTTKFICSTIDNRLITQAHARKKN